MGIIRKFLAPRGAWTADSSQSPLSKHAKNVRAIRLYDSGAFKISYRKKQLGSFTYNEQVKYYSFAEKAFA